MKIKIKKNVKWLGVVQRVLVLSSSSINLEVIITLKPKCMKSAFRFLHFRLFFSFLNLKVFGFSLFEFKSYHQFKNQVTLWIYLVRIRDRQRNLQHHHNKNICLRFDLLIYAGTSTRWNTETRSTPVIYCRLAYKKKLLSSVVEMGFS